jgi:hypothetical protein
MNIRILAALFLFLPGFSCTVFKEYPIEVYKPGEAVVPHSAKKAALVYRNFKYPADTLRHYYKDDFVLIKAKNDPSGLDSLLVTVCLNELAANLKNNNAFDELHLFPYHTFEKHSGEHLNEFSKELIEQVASTSGADLLISLDTWSYFFSTYPQTFDTPETNEVITVAVWSIYDASKTVLIERKTMIDTVFWNGYDEEGNYRKDYRPPPRLTSLELASALAGENYAKRFYATWQTVNRMYSVPPLPDFSEAAYFFEEGKLDRAISLWQKYAGNRNGKMAINARYNLALAFELKDDLDAARMWLSAALELASKYRSKEDIKIILAYQKILDRRRKEILKLNYLQNENIP